MLFLTKQRTCDVHYGENISAILSPSHTKRKCYNVLRQCDSKAVANFVTSIGYSDYAEQFHNSGLSSDVLIDCTDKDLKIESALARLKIVILFKQQIQGLNALAKNIPTERVVEFLDGLKPPEKEQYKQSFGDNEIDGEMLLAI